MAKTQNWLGKPDAQFRHAKCEISYVPRAELAAKRPGNLWKVLIFVFACLFAPRLIEGSVSATSQMPLDARSVSVVIDDRSPGPEVFAANELCRYLEELFNIQIKPTTAVPSSATFVFLVGSPATNSTLREATNGEGFPKLSDQGIVFRRTRWKRLPAVVIGGGSPEATLWAVYELVRRWGVRYLLHGDIFPGKQRFYLPGSDFVIEPKLRIRQWRVINDFAMGPASWGMADYRPVIDQVAKLKFNRLLIVLPPFSPYQDYQVDGIKRSSAAIFFGYHFPITDQMVGRQLFGSGKEFWNPDLPLDASYRQFEAAGERLVHSLIAYGHQRGMQSILALTPTQFPVEFAPLLPTGEKVPILGATVISPGPKTEIDDANLAKLAGAIIQSAVNTYPEADGIDVGVPEFREWTNEYQRAWKALDAHHNIERDHSLESIVNAARHRSGYPGGSERALNEVKGDIASLYFYDRLFGDFKILQGTKRPKIIVCYEGLAEELFPILGRILPPGSEALHEIDYTPSRVVHRQAVLNGVSNSKIPSVLIYTLNDDNIGPIPQLTTDSLSTLTKLLVRDGWSGFSTRYWNIGDQDTNVAYLSRASWDTDATPTGVAKDQLEAVCGQGCVVPMLNALQEVQRVTIDLEWNGLGFAFPVPGMMMRNWKPKPFPIAYTRAHLGYERALEEVRQAQKAVGGRGNSNYLDYWEGRLEFATGYLAAANDVNHAARAEAAADHAETLLQAREAIDTSRTAIAAFARVARDQSDRGAIAMLDEYVCRPLEAKAKSLQNGSRR